MVFIRGCRKLNNISYGDDTERKLQGLLDKESEQKYPIISKRDSPRCKLLIDKSQQPRTETELRSVLNEDKMGYRNAKLQWDSKCCPSKTTTY